MVQRRQSLVTQAYVVTLFLLAGLVQALFSLPLGASIGPLIERIEQGDFRGLVALPVVIGMPLFSGVLWCRVLLKAAALREWTRRGAYVWLLGISFATVVWSLCRHDPLVATLLWLLTALFVICHLFFVVNIIFHMQEQWQARNGDDAKL